MFSKSKKSSTENDTKSLPAINLISEGTHVQGNLTSDYGMRISGVVTGTVEVKGKCIVTSTAVIQGDLIAQDADISGKIDGEIIVKNKLCIRQSAHIVGNVRTKIIVIEEGANFEGTCAMSAIPVRKEPEYSSDFNIRQITSANR